MEEENLGMEGKNREEPIYEKLAPGEVLIISKKENCVVYAANEKGKVVLRKVCLLKKE